MKRVGNKHKHKEKVSIIIPCYNDGRYLKESIDSARSQTYSNKEIVLVDDGSDDALTLDIIRGFEKTKDVQVVYGNHGGPAAARNLGIRSSSGDFILPLDSDDKIEPEYVELAADILRSSSNVGMVYCKADYFDAKNGLWELEEFSLGQMLFSNVIFNAALFRKSDWVRAGGYHEELCGFEDWDFWLSLLDFGLRPVRIDKILFHYRIRQGGSSFSHKDIPHAQLMGLYHDILMRHESLYRSELVAYSDCVRVSISYKDDLNRRYQEALTEAKECCFKLSNDNRWVQMSRQIPWRLMEEKFAGNFDELKGQFSAPVRLSLGIYILKAETGLSDDQILLAIKENPYMQYFCGVNGEELKRLSARELSYIYERMTPSLMVEMNGLLGN